MKILFLAFCLWLTAMSAGAQTAAAKWTEFKLAEGRYSVSLPKEPTLSRQEALDGDGKPLPQFLARADDGGGIFVVAYFDYPAGGSYSLDDGRDGAVRNVKGKLVSENDIKLGTFLEKISW